jgi:uncharacterized peroxidase-related enzyme
MSWIETIAEDRATGKLKALYDELIFKRGKVANVMKAHSLNPASLEMHLRLYELTMLGESGLSRAERETVAVVISTINKCDYCIVHHADALNHYWRDKERLIKLVNDFQSAELPERAVEMCQYAVRLTLTPDKISQNDIEKLRKHLLSDKDILDLNLVVGYLNFAHRVILGLGVKFSPEEAVGYKY